MEGGSLDLLLDWSCNLKFFANLQGQMGQYRGQGHWNAKDRYQWVHSP